jgi:beta-galactosidase GanA
MLKNIATRTEHYPAISRVFAVSFIICGILSGCQNNDSSADMVNKLSNSTHALPQLITQNGKHAFMVDDKPYLILGAQSNNSANYPAALEKVWPVIEKMSANTLSIPVAWEQIEPLEGQFDFSFLDVLIAQARERNVRLNLLWFATWKNNAPHYAPGWVKLDNKRFPRVVKKDGERLNSMSPLGKNTLEADKKAFIKLMEYLKNYDKQHTVIMVQIENEVGTYGAKRDFSDLAEAQFKQNVPLELVKGMKLKNGSWSEVFAQDADEYFHAWYIAKFCEELAIAGKAVKNLPMNVNVALRNPFFPGDGYSMGGPTDNVIDLWKIAAPNIDMISPDIYFRDHKTVDKVMSLYSRKDNPLFISEIGNDQPYARYFFTSLGYQGIGFAPFGMDYTDYANYPLGAKTVNEQTIAPFAELYHLVKPFAAEWAKLSLENQVWGVAEPHDSLTEKQSVWNAKTTDSEDEMQQGNIKLDPDLFTQNLDLGLWNAEVTYGRLMFWIDPPIGNSPASGGALIAKLSDNEYLVTALRARVSFSPSDELAGQAHMIERVEEGHFENGAWVFERVWNGDQTDWGLNFTSEPHLLKVKMATYAH